MKYEKPELEKLELMSPYMFVSCSVDDPDWDPDVPDDDEDLNPIEGDPIGFDDH